MVVEEVGKDIVFELRGELDIEVAKGIEFVAFEVIGGAVGGECLFKVEEEFWARCVVFCGWLVGVDIEEEIGVTVGGAEGVELHTSVGDTRGAEGGVG